MFRVSYIINNSILHKSFETEKAAREWIEKSTNIKPLKLLIWDNEIDCYSTVETFNSDYGNATGTVFYKKVYV